MPSSEDIDDPAALIARLTAASRGEAAPSDAMDDALAQLLAEEADGARRDAESESPDAGTPGAAAPDAGRPTPGARATRRVTPDATAAMTMERLRETSARCDAGPGRRWPLYAADPL